MTRRLLSIFLMGSLLLSGCSSLAATPVPTMTVVPTVPVETYSFSGRVIDMEGNPIQGASVESQTGQTTSSADGWFELPSQGSPDWITVSKEGFIPRTRAAAPRAPALFRLTPDDGKTIAVQFGGDTMFGRRFFDPNEDGDTTDGLLPEDPDSQAHLKLLAPIEPLLGNSDLTVLNLETPLTDQPYFSPRDPRPTVYHDTKDYVFSSDTSLVGALKQAGVDVVDIGNNHLYDLLEEGVKSTIAALDNGNLNHFGGGATEASAWTPAVVTVKDQKIAFIGCTTIGQPIPAVTDHDIKYVASDRLKKGGAALCEESKLRSVVHLAKQAANIVVVMIHGGYEYVRAPSNNIMRLTLAASEAGATLVINHHPHVAGGFLWENQSLIAWSMGNFVFDQDVWPTFETYLLTVYLRDGKVIRAHADPLVLKDYIPHGLTAEEADHVIRNAAMAPGPFVIENGALEVDIDQHAVQNTYSSRLDGEMETGKILAIPPSQWVSGFQGTGKLRLGRDLLWVGGFENDEVASGQAEPPLWEKPKESVQAGKDYAYAGNSGIRLTRSASNQHDVVTSHLHRLLIEPGAKLSIIGMLRTSRGALAHLQISWYSDNRGPSFLQMTDPVEAAASDQWQPFRFDVQAPAEAAAVQVYLRLSPPAQGVVTADFDNLRVIQWAAPETAYSPFFDYALLTGTGTLTVTQPVLPGAEEWLNASTLEQIK